MTVILVEELNELNVPLLAEFDGAPEELTGQVHRDDRVVVRVNHDDGEVYEGEVLVRDEVDVRTGREEPGEERAGEEETPGSGPGVEIELV